MLSKNTILTTLLILCLCLGVAASAAAKEPSVGSSRVIWEAENGFGLTLTVSGPDGYYHRQDFAAGAAPGFDLFDDAGQYKADGLYTWELVASPVAKPAERSAEAPTVQGAAHSGSFSILDGAFLDPNVKEPESVVLPEAGGDKQLITGNLTVRDSLCVGNDCVNSEAYGFDTVRLKENNLRIKFQDTSSSSGSFPTNDWQFTFNASSSGGANFFAIDDINGSATPFKIEAGARNNALYVEQDGDIGIGTANPAVDLHIKTGNSPTLRLEQDGSSGFTQQIWDIAGNEANFFVRDTTNGSKLPFKIKPNAPVDSLYVAGNGAVGMGTSNPGDDLHVRRTSGNAALRLETTEADGTAWILRSQTTGQMQWRDNGAGTIPVRIGPGAQNNLLNIGMSADGNTADPDRINITGELYINGADNSTPDYVFESDYELMSIEQQAEYMWTHKHLPSVPKAELGEDGKTKFSMIDRAQGVLEELEKAHIYIEQLHDRLAEVEDLLEKLSSE